MAARARGDALRPFAAARHRRAANPPRARAAAGSAALCTHVERGPPPRDASPPCNGDTLAFYVPADEFDAWA
jgi:hypothetical protein